MRYKQPSLSSAVRFEKAPISGIEFSRMSVNPRVYTTYNAGDIVPVYYEEVLPHSTFSVDVDFVNRLLSATLKPTMGSMQIDLFAFFVPNRVVNESWKNVQGENTSGYWSAPEVQLAPLYPMTDAVQASVQIPVGSVADYYGLPTQKPIPKAILSQMNDLKERGYLEIVNNYFRDQNYQPPYSYSKLNVYNGFLQPFHSFIELDGERMAGTGTEITTGDISDGSYANGAIAKALYGEGNGPNGRSVITGRVSNWSALDKPIKANKLHDYFTSGLPSPQKGPEVYFGLADTAPVVTSEEVHALGFPLKFNEGMTSYNVLTGGPGGKATYSNIDGIRIRPADTTEDYTEYDASFRYADATEITRANLIADLSSATGVSINDLRIAAATQQVYEILARGGSRYLEVLRNMFGIEAENPFKDIPTQLGHIRRELDLYQVAQTSNSVDGETPQGNLAGFGYTSNGGNMFTYTALEHGYIHFLAVVRHRNIYSTYCAPDNFRMNTLDWYQPPLANIGEQPLKKALLNPFEADSLENSIAFQEAWAEYRYSPDRVSGYCRTGLSGGLDIWTYADPYDEYFSHVNGDWLRSNSQEVLDRTLAVTSEVSPQFIAMFEFKITKQLPMPIYSVPGLDVL